MTNFRFAVMGAGNIANKFCDAVNRIADCEVAAVASKSMERAQAFARKTGLNADYDSYEKMLIEEKPDCVYIAVTTDAHYALTMLCLEHKVPVLCEKAMFVNSAQAETVFEKARQEKIFVMEAMWSRFLPAIKMAKQWMDEGKIGTPSFIDTAIGFLAPVDKDNRYYSPKLGGGAAFDITVYAYELTTYMAGRSIENMQVSAVWSDTGVDLSDQVTICYPGLMASLRTSFAAALHERMAIYGSEGKIVIPHPHFAEEAFLYNKANELVMHFQDTVTENGFLYEIEEAVNCIRDGRIESPVVPHSLTLDCARLFDRINSTRP